MSSLDQQLIATLENTVSINSNQRQQASQTLINVPISKTYDFRLTNTMALSLLCCRFRSIPM